MIDRAFTLTNRMHIPWIPMQLREASDNGTSSYSRECNLFSRGWLKIILKVHELSMIQFHQDLREL